MALQSPKVLAARLRSMIAGARPVVGGAPQVPSGAASPAGPGVSPPRFPGATSEALRGHYEDTEATGVPPSIALAGHTDAEVIGFIQHCRNEAWNARWPHEGRFHTNQAYYYDKQWDFWDTGTRTLRHYRELDPNPHREWLVVNLVTPKVRKLIARALSANQEVLISPRTTAEADKDASEATSAIVEHIACVNHEDAMTLEIERRRHIIGPVFVKIWVDWKASLLVPITAPAAPLPGGDFPIPPPANPLMGTPPSMGAPAPMPGIPAEGEESPYPQFEEEPEPEVLGVREVQSGDIRKEIVPWYEALPDPRSHDPKKWEYFVHEKQLTISEVRARFPERGKYVKPGIEAMQLDREVKTGLNNGDNNTTWGRSRMNEQVVTVQELWHLPCPAFPKGLVAWCANGVLLWVGEWLYPSLKQLPFVMYCYEDGIDTPWGFSAVEKAKGPQDLLNKTIGILVDGANEGMKLLNPVNSGLRADSFRRGRPNEVLTYDPMSGGANGFKPELLQTSGTRQETYKLLEEAQAAIAEILEVQPVSDGLVPAGVTAAAAIQSLQQSNQQGSRLTIEGFRLSKLLETEIEVALAKEVYTGEAILSMRDSAATVADKGTTDKLNVIMDLLAAVPGVEQSDYMGALDQYAKPADSGAKSRVIRFDALAKGRIDVDVRVTASKDPAQRLATLQDMASKGFFSPENIETTVVLLEAMQLEDADKLTERLLRVLTRIQARQERLMQQQSQQAQEQADAQVQAEQAKSQAQAESDAMKAQVDSEAKLAQIQAEGQVKADLMRLEAELKLTHEIQMAQVQAEIARENAAQGLMGDLTRSEHAAMLEGEEDDDEGEDEPAPRKPRRRRRKKPTLNLEGASLEVAAEEQEELESGDENGEVHGTEGEILPSGEFLRYDDPDHMAIEEALEEQYPDGLGTRQPSDTDDTDLLTNPELYED